MQIQSVMDTEFNMQGSLISTFPEIVCPGNPEDQKIDIIWYWDNQFEEYSIGE